MRRKSMLVASSMAATAFLATAYVMFSAGTPSEPAGGKNSNLEISLVGWEERYESCKKEPGPESCLIRLTQTAVSQGEFGAALSILDRGRQEVPRFLQVCHQLAHEIGEAVIYAGNTLEQAYAVEWPHCLIGYYHGALYGHAKGMTIEQLHDNLDRLCLHFGGEESIVAGECVHLVGHLILVQADLDLERGFEECSRMREGMFQLQCIDGVLMEAVDQARGTSDFDGIDIPRDPRAREKLFGEDEDSFPERMLSLCLSSPRNMRPPCFISIPNALGVLWELDFERIGSFCAEVEDRAARRGCFQGIAVSAFSSMSWDTEVLLGACYAYDSPHSVHCIENVATVVTEYSTDLERAEALCSQVKPEHLEACREGASLGYRRAMGTVVLGRE